MEQKWEVSLLQTPSYSLELLRTPWNSVSISQVLYTAHQEVVEERCELEEAENDSRLRAQK